MGALMQHLGKNQKKTLLAEEFFFQSENYLHRSAWLHKHEHLYSRLLMQALDIAHIRVIKPSSFPVADE